MKSATNQPKKSQALRKAGFTALRKSCRLPEMVHRFRFCHPYKYSIVFWSWLIGSECENISCLFLGGVYGGPFPLHRRLGSTFETHCAKWKMA